VSDVRHVVERYNFELWNQKKYEIAPEIIGDHIIRNSPGCRIVLSHEEAVERVRSAWSKFDHMEFTLLRTVTDGELCTIVYQAEMRAPDGTQDSIASIEVFRVVDGRIVEVWNNSHDHGRWPEAEEVPE
jgi:predicted SnoaL-like aldol condensation-catalyzing enzyme